MSTRTDLALEARDIFLETATEISGVTSNERIRENFKVTHIKIETEEAEKAIGKPIGNYKTIEFPDILNFTGEVYDKMSHVLSQELADMIYLNDETKILVVGLGNRFITSDALGPAVIKKIMITRHLFSYLPDSISDGLRSVCAISPGVLGITGIETVEIIKGVIEKANPDALIVIDALAARDIKRVLSTVQISDTGINPGSGVGNNRKELSKKTLGIPTIAIGVPTVIDAITIFKDTALKLTEKFSDFDFDNILPSPQTEKLQSFMVTPKEIDLLIEKMASIIANGINLALHKNISIEDIEAFIS